jgi:hypothetical protein
MNLCPRPSAIKTEHSVGVDKGISEDGPESDYDESLRSLDSDLANGGSSLIVAKSSGIGFGTAFWKGMSTSIRHPTIRPPHTSMS